MERVFDVVVIGAGMAGASAAAFLSEASPGRAGGGRGSRRLSHHRPLRRAVDRELRPAGRAVADPPVARIFRNAAGWFRHRAVDAAADRAVPGDDSANARNWIRRWPAAVGLRRVAVAEAETMLPALRPGYLAAAAVEDDAFDMDVSAIHQGFLRRLRSRNGVLALRSRAGTHHPRVRRVARRNLVRRGVPGRRRGQRRRRLGR